MRQRQIHLLSFELILSRTFHRWHQVPFTRHRALPFRFGYGWTSVHLSFQLSNVWPHKFSLPCSVCPGCQPLWCNALNSDCYYVICLPHSQAHRSWWLTDGIWCHPGRLTGYDSEIHNHRSTSFTCLCFVCSTSASVESGYAEPFVCDLMPCFSQHVDPLSSSTRLTTPFVVTIQQSLFPVTRLDCLPMAHSLAMHIPQ